MQLRYKLAASLVVLVALLPSLFRAGSLLKSTPLDPLVGNVLRAEPAVLRQRLAHKRALIIGGTKGIGRATALALAGAGASVTVVGRTGGDAVVQAMEAASPSDGATQFAYLRADLSTVRGSAALAAQVVGAGGAPIDYLVFTVGVWPNFADPFTADGIERVVALDVLARFVVLEGVKEALGPGARIMSVMGSTLELPFPPQAEVRRIVSGDNLDGGLGGILTSAAAAADAMMRVAARENEGLTFIGMHPGLLKTYIAASTFGGPLNALLGVLTAPIALSEEECGAVHVHVLTADNAERSGPGRPAFFNHWLEGREASGLAQDHEFGEWVWAWLHETRARLQ